MGKNFSIIYLSINAGKLPGPRNIIEKLSVVVSVVVRAVRFSVVTRRQSCHLVSIYRIATEEVFHLVCNL